MISCHLTFYLLWTTVEVVTVLFVYFKQHSAGATLDNTLNALTDSPMEAVLWRTLLLEASGASTTIEKLLNTADGKKDALNSTAKERFLQAHMKMITVSVGEDITNANMPSHRSGKRLKRVFLQNSKPT